MIRVIVVDAREDFLADINTRMILDDERELTIMTTLASAEHLHIALQRYPADIVAVCENLIDTQEDWFFAGTQVVGYALSPEGIGKFDARNIPSYGVIKKVTNLLDCLERGVPERKKPKAAPPPVRKEPEEDAVISQPTAEVEPEPERPEPAMPQKATQEPASPRNIRSQLSRYREATVKEEERRIEREFSVPKRNTQVVTVYSAKGGVGKTTLSTEIAVYLALTCGGRDRYKVCLVDYNIDFGDVLTTLDFKSDGPNMALWAKDIRDRMASGEDPDRISYSSAEVKAYLQVMEKTGLYALLEPIVHEDSLSISEEALQVMLRSIVQCGEFDFVICDTGNNTRDAAVVALEMAQYVLLVANQDVTTANCNDSFLTTMKRLHFDMDKIRLVINNVQPPKLTGVTVREIEELFPYPCIARIRHDTDVVRANNFSKPIVYEPQHEVTKEIRKIISFLTGTEEPQTAKRKGLFGLKLGR